MKSPALNIASSDANHSCFGPLFLSVDALYFSQQLFRVFRLDIVHYNMLVLEIVTCYVNNSHRLQYSCLSHKGFRSVIIFTISRTFSAFMFVLGMFVSGCNLASEKQRKNKQGK